MRNQVAKKAYKSLRSDKKQDRIKNPSARYDF